MSALKTLSLEVVRAAVTTTPQGFANDVFEARRSGGEDAIDASVVQGLVLKHALAGGAGGAKRPKPH